MFHPRGNLTELQYAKLSSKSARRWGDFHCEEDSWEKCVEPNASQICVVFLYPEDNVIRFVIASFLEATQSYSGDQGNWYQVSKSRPRAFIQGLLIFSNKMEGAFYSLGNTAFDKTIQDNGQL